MKILIGVPGKGATRVKKGLLLKNNHRGGKTEDKEHGGGITNGGGEPRARDTGCFPTEKAR